MKIREFLNVQRVLRTIAAQWQCPVYQAKRRIQQAIDQSWQMAQSDPGEKAVLDFYFPQGKPTPEQYILKLGRAHEQGEAVPTLLKM